MVITTREKTIDDMLFASVDLPSLDKELATQQVLAVDKSLWWWDKYRATSMLPLMTKEAKAGVIGSSNSRGGDFQWLGHTPECIRVWFDTVVFPWMGTKTRVMALMTKPNFANEEHIDCDPHKMGTMQHKFRIVVHGKTSTLYFKTTKGDVNVPEVDGPFLMDGSWLHGMNNTTDDFKLTIAAGAPWNGNPQYDNVTNLMLKSDYEMPDNYKDYFQIVHR
jgi:hypothetical protein